MKIRKIMFGVSLVVVSLVWGFNAFNFIFNQVSPTNFEIGFALCFTSIITILIGLENLLNVEWV